MSRFAAIGVWASLTLIVIAPIAIAALSPLLQWRDTIYIVAGFGGVAALSLMLLQPLLAMGVLPGLSLTHGRRIHRWTGGALVTCIGVHVIGLWITSPPDVIDALLFASATPFSIWGVIAMWSIVLSAFLVVYRRKLRLRAATWRIGHRIFATITVSGTVAHAMMIEGTMGTLSKTALCLLLIIATAFAVLSQLGRLIKTHYEST